MKFRDLLLKPMQFFTRVSFLNVVVLSVFLFPSNRDFSISLSSRYLLSEDEGLDQLTGATRTSPPLGPGTPPASFSGEPWARPSHVGK